ncbi:ankyrin repeat domain-containing protein, partial [bacterium]|nr:ankyrin repeat domain-containing protein [bacterium]
EWILSNFASQQTLLRTLDGLSAITGDPKYRDAAKQAIKYAFENLRAPKWLFYWGHYVAYDAQRDEIKYAAGRSSKRHILKVHYPYYELMWQVDPEATKRFIGAYWSAHVRDWSNLDFDRISVDYSDLLEEPWRHEYTGGPTFFQSKSNAGGFLNTGTSLAHAAATLYELSKEEQPLVRSRRLIKRFVDTRHPATGMTKYMYNKLPFKVWEDDSTDHFADKRSFIFPSRIFAELRKEYYPESVVPHQWMSLLLVGDMLGERGRDFVRWATEELTAWGKASYRRQDNTFIPIITDGTNVEGYVLKEDCPIGDKGDVAAPVFADLAFFWAYATAYRITGDEFMWQMARDICSGNEFGDIGENPRTTPEVKMNTICSDVYGLLGFLELYAKTGEPDLLSVARRIGDNIIENKCHKGFFVPSKNHIYTRHDSFEPLALLYLVATIESQSESVPRVWPSSPLFVPPYRYKREGVDRRIIYTLTESPEVPISLQEAATIGNIDMVRSLIEEAVDVDGIDDSVRWTALQCAVSAGHKDVAELLISKGARIDRTFGESPLHIATLRGHTGIVGLLIAKGADVNAKDNNGMIPLHDAVAHGYRELVELLFAKGADVHAKDKWKRTPLYYAVSKGHKEIAELLSAHCQPGEELDGLRIGISQVKRPEQNDYDKPRFNVALQNIGKKDLVLNLGIMLANGKEQYATAVKLIFTDHNGKSYEFRNNIGRHPGIAGRVDPFLVPLAGGCTYALRVDFDNYWLVPVGTSLPKGQYHVAAVFEGKALDFKDTDLYTRDTYWAGVIKSKEVLFKNTHGGSALQKYNYIVFQKGNHQFQSGR